MEESESGSCACVFESLIVDEIEKVVFIFLRFFVDDSVMPLKMLNMGIL